jgi:DNA-binding transcriptional MerR regulator
MVLTLDYGQGFSVMHEMTIGRVATAARISIDTIRFYERRGIVAQPRRNFSGYRVYSSDVLERLRFIADAKALGFSLREIRELLSLGVKSTQECGPVTRKAEAKLAAMNDEIRRLQSMRRTLEKMIADCTGACECGGSCSRCAKARKSSKESSNGSGHLHQPRMLRVPSGEGISHQSQRELRRKKPGRRSVGAR